MTNETPKTSNFQLFLRVLKRQEVLRSKLPLLSVLLFAYVAFNVSEPYFYKLFIDVVDSVLSGKIDAASSIPIFVKYALLWGGLTLASVFASFSYLHQVWSI